MRILFVGIFALLLSFCSSQRTYTMNGYLTEKGSGESLIGANIYVQANKLSTRLSYKILKISSRGMAARVAAMRVCRFLKSGVAVPVGGAAQAARTNTLTRTHIHRCIVQRL